MATLSSAPGAGPSHSLQHPSHVEVGATAAALQMVQIQRQVVENDISEYEVLLSKFEELEINNEAIESITELGAGVWVNTRISDTKSITLDLGLGVHLDLSIDDAKIYTIKKLEILKKRRDSLAKREAGLLWQFSQRPIVK